MGKCVSDLRSNETRDLAAATPPCCNIDGKAGGGILNISCPSDYRFCVVQAELRFLQGCRSYKLSSPSYRVADPTSRAAHPTGLQILQAEQPILQGCGSYKQSSASYRVADPKKLESGCVIRFWFQHPDIRSL